MANIYGQLIVRKKSGSDGPRFLIEKRHIVFGNSVECDIRIHRKKVASKQCSLTIDETGKAYVENLNPSILIKVDDEPITYSQIKSGQFLLIEKRLFRYEEITEQNIRENIQQENATTTHAVNKRYTTFEVSGANVKPSWRKQLAKTRQSVQLSRTPTDKPEIPRRMSPRRCETSFKTIKSSTKKSQSNIRRSSLGKKVVTKVESSNRALKRKHISGDEGPANKRRKQIIKKRGRKRTSVGTLILRKKTKRLTPVTPSKIGATSKILSGYSTAIPLKFKFRTEPSTPAMLAASRLRSNMVDFPSSDVKDSSFTSELFENDEPKHTLRNRSTQKSEILDDATELSKSSKNICVFSSPDKSTSTPSTTSDFINKTRIRSRSIARVVNLQDSISKQSTRTFSSVSIVDLLDSEISEEELTTPHKTLRNRKSNISGNTFSKTNNMIEDSQILPCNNITKSSNTINVSKNRRNLSISVDINKKIDDIPETPRQQKTFLLEADKIVCETPIFNLTEKFTSTPKAFSSIKHGKKSRTMNVSKISTLASTTAKNNTDVSITNYKKDCVDTTVESDDQNSCSDSETPKSLMKLKHEALKIQHSTARKHSSKRTEQFHESISTSVKRLFKDVDIEQDAGDSKVTSAYEVCQINSERATTPKYRKSMKNSTDSSLITKTNMSKKKKRQTCAATRNESMVSELVMTTASPEIFDDSNEEKLTNIRNTSKFVRQESSSSKSPAPVPLNKISEVLLPNNTPDLSQSLPVSTRRSIRGKQNRSLLSKTVVYETTELRDHLNSHNNVSATATSNSLQIAKSQISLDDASTAKTSDSIIYDITEEKYELQTKANVRSRRSKKSFIDLTSSPNTSNNVASEFIDISIAADRNNMAEDASVDKTEVYSEKRTKNNLQNSRLSKSLSEFTLSNNVSVKGTVDPHQTTDAVSQNTSKISTNDISIANASESVIDDKSQTGTNLRNIKSKKSLGDFTSGNNASTYVISEFHEVSNASNLNTSNPSKTPKNDDSTVNDTLSTKKNARNRRSVRSISEIAGSNNSLTNASSNFHEVSTPRQNKSPVFAEIANSMVYESKSLQTKDNRSRTRSTSLVNLASSPRLSEDNLISNNTEDIYSYNLRGSPIGDGKKRFIISDSDDLSKKDGNVSPKTTPLNSSKPKRRPFSNNKENSAVAMDNDVDVSNSVNEKSHDVSALNSSTQQSQRTPSKHSVNMSGDSLEKDSSICSNIDVIFKTPKTIPRKSKLKTPSSAKINESSEKRHRKSLNNSSVFSMSGFDNSISSCLPIDDFVSPISDRIDDRNSSVDTSVDKSLVRKWLPTTSAAKTSITSHSLDLDVTDASNMSAMQLNDDALVVLASSTPQLPVQDFRDGIPKRQSRRKSRRNSSFNTSAQKSPVNKSRSLNGSTPINAVDTSESKSMQSDSIEEGSRNKSSRQSFDKDGLNEIANMQKVLQTPPKNISSINDSNDLVSVKKLSRRSKSLRNDSLDEKHSVASNLSAVQLQEDSSIVKDDNDEDNSQTRSRKISSRMSSINTSAQETPDNKSCLLHVSGLSPVVAADAHESKLLKSAFSESVEDGSRRSTKRSSLKNRLSETSMQKIPRTQTKNTSLANDSNYITNTEDISGRNKSSRNNSSINHSSYITSIKDISGRNKSSKNNSSNLNHTVTSNLSTATQIEDDLPVTVGILNDGSPIRNSSLKSVNVSSSSPVVVIDSSESISLHVDGVVKKDRSGRKSSRRSSLKYHRNEVADLEVDNGTSTEDNAPDTDANDVTSLKKLSRRNKSPKNDLTDIRGVKQLYKTPIALKSPKNDLTDVRGVRNLLKTPTAVKSPKNSLSDLRGVKRLVSTPKIVKSPLNDLTDVKGTKKLFATPKNQKSPLNDLSDLRGIGKLLKTPKRTNTPKNNLSDLSGVAQLLSAPSVDGCTSRGEIFGSCTEINKSGNLSKVADTRNEMDKLFDELIQKPTLRTYKRSKSVTTPRRKHESSIKRHTLAHINSWINDIPNNLTSFEEMLTSSIKSSKQRKSQFDTEATVEIEDRLTNIVPMVEATEIDSIMTSEPEITEERPRIIRKGRKILERNITSVDSPTRPKRGRHVKDVPAIADTSIHDTETAPKPKTRGRSVKTTKKTESDIDPLTIANPERTTRGRSKTVKPDQKVEAIEKPKRTRRVQVTEEPVTNERDKPENATNDGEVVKKTRGTRSRKLAVEPESKSVEEVPEKRTKTSITKDADPLPVRRTRKRNPVPVENAEPCEVEKSELLTPAEKSENGTPVSRKRTRKLVSVDQQSTPVDTTRTQAAVASKRTRNTVSTEDVESKEIEKSEKTIAVSPKRTRNIRVDQQLKKDTAVASKVVGRLRRGRAASTTISEVDAQDTIQLKTRAGRGTKGTPTASPILRKNRKIAKLVVTDDEGQSASEMHSSPISKKPVADTGDIFVGVTPGKRKLFSKDAHVDSYENLSIEFLTPSVGPKRVTRTGRSRAAAKVPDEIKTIVTATTVEVGNHSTQVVEKVVTATRRRKASSDAKKCVHFSDESAPEPPRVTRVTRAKARARTAK